MKFNVIFIIILITIADSSISTANIYAINFNKINGIEDYHDEAEFLFTNLTLYNHWSPEWNSEFSKDEIIDRLAKIYIAFSILKPEKNIELYLLLGDIAHFLYNLEQEEFFSIAIENYNKCINIDEKEFRAYWFLGNHYAYSGLVIKSINNFLKAEGLLSDGYENAIFWEEYAFATSSAGMVSHTIYAMERANENLGYRCHFDETLGDEIRSILKASNIDSTYESKDLWNLTKDELNTFVNRPLGIKFSIDSTWGTDFTDYTNRAASIMIEPLTEVGYNNIDIGYTIAILAKVPKKDEGFWDFLKSVTPFNSERKLVNITSKYKKSVSFELQNLEIYKKQGGANVYMLVIQRDLPIYPGKDLEIPSNFLEGPAGKLKYYRLEQIHNRFESKIYYAILLDCCKSIHKNAFERFKTFINEELILE